MRKRSGWLWAMPCLVVLTAAACSGGGGGGGGGDDDDDDDGVGPVEVTVADFAGSAIAGAAVLVHDQDGATLIETETAIDGTVSFEVPLGAGVTVIQQTDDVESYGLLKTFLAVEPGDQLYVTGLVESLPTATPTPSPIGTAAVRVASLGGSAGTAFVSVQMIGCPAVSATVMGTNASVQFLEGCETDTVTPVARLFTIAPPATLGFAFLPPASVPSMIGATTIFPAWQSELDFPISVTGIPNGITRVSGLFSREDAERNVLGGGSFQEDPSAATLDTTAPLIPIPYASTRYAFEAQIGQSESEIEARVVGALDAFTVDLESELLGFVNSPFLTIVDSGGNLAWSSDAALGTAADQMSFSLSWDAAGRHMTWEIVAPPDTAPAIRTPALPDAHAAFRLTRADAGITKVVTFTDDGTWDDYDDARNLQGQPASDSTGAFILRRTFAADIP